ncbi:DUF2381 family protein [Corallococcus exiguus]|uniref:DUF2381 family protein n=1 Tax=Corallococcus TaxID=83461 RepID=UPI000EA3531A|nr:MULTISPECIES: DUF2381 family protein [Corallococcus]NNC21764.1 DUF2381 family protein [Corallococcus exiguus]NRD58491.1 DUF2381 family protein [Corallococcus exiguus]RKH24142.1 DUF2381 family protein [Corallococcus sp. CA041A]RKI08318.1 DUF2381 family protein [Corallococcus sp. AB030]RUO93732.1 DUF2381 family protein [Corallococcus sp. AB018]
MSLSTSLIPLVLTILMGTTAVAQTRTPVVRERKARQLTLRSEEPPVLHPLHVAAHEVTTVTFDAPIVPESVDRSVLAPFFTRVAVHEDVLVLKASMDVPVGKEPVITVRFAGPGAPAQVGFVLTTVAAEVDSQVEVFRQGRTAQDLGKELADLRAHCAVTEAGLATLRAQCALSGLGGAVLTGAVTQEGITVDYIRESPVSMGIVAEGPHVIYRTASTRALSTSLRNPMGAAPWLPGFARVTPRGPDAGGIPVREIPLLIQVRQLAPGERSTVVVEWNALPDLPPGAHFTLELLDVKGERGIRWEQVSP